MTRKRLLGSCKTLRQIIQIEMPTQVIHRATMLKLQTSKIVLVPTSRLPLIIDSNQLGEETMLLSSRVPTKIVLRLGNNSLDPPLATSSRGQASTIWDTTQMCEEFRIVFSSNNSSKLIIVINSSTLWTFKTRQLRILKNHQSHLKLEMAWSFWIKVVFNINSSRSQDPKVQTHLNQGLFLSSRRGLPKLGEDLAQLLFQKKPLTEHILKMSVDMLMEVDKQVIRVKTWRTWFKRRWPKDTRAQEADDKLWMHLGRIKTSLFRMLPVLETRNIALKWFNNRMVQCRSWLVEESAVLIWTILVLILSPISHRKIETRVVKLETINTEKDRASRLSSVELPKEVRAPLLPPNLGRIPRSMVAEKSLR